jgi:hypothetical protein
MEKSYLIVGPKEWADKSFVSLLQQYGLLDGVTVVPCSGDSIMGWLKDNNITELPVIVNLKFNEKEELYRNYLSLREDYCQTCKNI